MLKYFCVAPLKIYLHEYLTHEYFHTRKFPDLWYLVSTNSYTIYVHNCIGKVMCINLLTVTERTSTVIAHPGQDVELLCTVTPSGSQTAAWIINNVLYTIQQLHNGILTGYSSNGNNLIIENIMMNDDRNDTEYSCGTVSSTVSNPIFADIVAESDPIILYVADEYQYNKLMY